MADWTDNPTTDHYLQRKRPAPGDEHTDGRVDNGVRNLKTQRSVSDELGPGLDCICRLDDRGLEALNTGDTLSGSWCSRPGGEGGTGVGENGGGAGGGTDEMDHGVPQPQPQPQQVSEPVVSPDCAAGEDAIDGGFFEDLLHKAERKISKITQKITETFRKIVAIKNCVEDNVHNNIHVLHPDGFSQTGMIALGMNVQKVNRGHQIRVLPEGLAHKAELQDDDIIVAVNEQDVQDWEFEKLQEFFGNMKALEIKLLVERKNEDEPDTEDGKPAYRKVAITIQLTFKDDKIIADVEITYNAWSWRYASETEPHYIFQNDGHSNTKYLMYKDGAFCMSSASNLTPCKFKLLSYNPNYNIPKALLNIEQNSPVDMNKPNLLGSFNNDLYGSGLNLFTDSRFFFTLRQVNTSKFTFELTSQKDHFLVADDQGKLTAKKFNGIESVTPGGLFDMVKASLIKHDGTDKNDKASGKPQTAWKK